MTRRPAISDARTLCRMTGARAVIVIALDRDHVSAASYGETNRECAAAGAIGDRGGFSTRIELIGMIYVWRGPRGGLRRPRWVEPIRREVYWMRGWWALPANDAIPRLPYRLPTAEEARERIGT